MGSGRDIGLRLAVASGVAAAHGLVLGAMAITTPPQDSPPPMIAIDVELVPSFAPPEIVTAVSSEAEKTLDEPPRVTTPIAHQGSRAPPASTPTPVSSRPDPLSISRPDAPGRTTTGSIDRTWRATPPTSAPPSTATSRPSAVTSPPTSSTAAPHPASAAAASATYQQRLLAHLERHKRYPRAARSHRQQGVATVRFTIDRQGHVLSSRLIQSAGHELLDREVMAMLERAQPLPSPPPEVPGPVLDLTIPVEFSLR